MHRPRRRSLSPLTDHLRASGRNDVVLTFRQIESILGRSLPRSAYDHLAFWSNSARNAYSYGWRDAGYSVTRAGLGPESVRFVRNRAPVDPTAVSAVHPTAVRTGTVEPDIPDPGRVTAILVGCVATKQTLPQPARDLYTSQLFLGRRAYAEARGRPWYVLSALHGLTRPDTLIEPYDVSLVAASTAERRRWAEMVAGQLQEVFGPLRGRVFEVHAGAEYVDPLRSRLHAVGATLVKPLEGLRIGEQLSFYATYGDRRVLPAEVPGAPVHVSGLAREITGAFNDGRLDLSRRQSAPPAGWAGMPEIVVREEMHKAGLGPVEFRLLATFVAAMDRAREADRLWWAGLDLARADPWAMHPEEIVRRSFTELSDVLIVHGVSQRHLQDAAAWRRIAESLTDSGSAPEIHRAIYDGRGDARELIEGLQRRTDAGTARFPLLSGPKVGVMWIRILAFPGGATISSLDSLPVAVDVQVRKITEYLGVTRTRGQQLEAVRKVIQDAWARDVAHSGAAGPEALIGTCAALDPALWFYAKWGCTHCERMARKVPIGGPCRHCRFDTVRASGMQT